MSEENVLDLKVNKTSIIADLEEIEAKRKAVDAAVKQSGVRTAETFNMAVGVAQASRKMMKDLLELGGVAVDTTTETVVDAAFSSLQVMKSLAVTYSAAGAVSPMHAVAAFMTFAAITTSTIATLQAEQRGKELSQKVDKSLDLLRSTNDFIGNFNFFR